MYYNGDRWIRASYLCRDIEDISFIGKYQQHTLTKLIGVGMNGTIWFVGPSYEGSMNDKNLYDLPENWIHQRLKQHETIGADAGFKGKN